MSEPTKEILSDGTPVRGEEIGYSADELKKCPACERTNSPQRNTCIYCGTHIPGNTSSAGLEAGAAGKLESWERGFSLVAVIENGIEQDQISSAGAMLGLDGDLVARICRTGACIPVGRFAAEDDANRAINSLENAGVRFAVVSEIELRPDAPPKRLKAIEFRPGEVLLTAFNGGETFTIANDDISLVVTGTIVSERVDRLEKRKRRGRSQTSEEGYSSSSFRVMDIYGTQDMTAYRIVEHGFDFSGLGEECSPLAGQNMAKIVARCRSTFSNARIESGYDHLRVHLDGIWPPDVSTNDRGVVRAGFFKSEIERSATTTNITQFQYFSRLQRFLR